jgi:transcriptional regulator with XRE-family HTH domain
MAACTPIPPSLGDALYAALCARGHSRADLAAELGVSEAHIDSLICGRRRPSLLLLQRIATWLDVPLDTLVEPAVPVVRSHRILPLVQRVGSVLGALGTLCQEADDAQVRAGDATEMAYQRGRSAAFTQAQALVRAALRTPSPGS